MGRRKRIRYVNLGVVMDLRSFKDLGQLSHHDFDLLHEVVRSVTRYDVLPIKGYLLCLRGGVDHGNLEPPVLE